MRFLWSLLLVLAALVTACSTSGEPVNVGEVLVTRIFITTTPKPTPTASPTATSTRTPTPTPTPTPTAPAMEVRGNPRAYTLFDPVPQSGAPCGWADTLDFPLDPPDGESAMGGRDFGVYRDRYDKYHAGEDWGLSSRSNFGKPVYSIGHGQVTYAQPLGWGADKGVVIIRHTFPDGNSVLSFYGHLDPPSVTIREGICVRRGEIIGQIGRPRTPPHLHFEMRVHMPYATGGGYWPSDPTNAGWLPPSQTVSQYRLQVAPGVVWANAASSTLSLPLGNLDRTTFLIIEGTSLLGINLFTGEALWSYELNDYIKDALLDPANGVLYVVDLVAGLQAYDLPIGNETPPDELELLWDQSLLHSSRLALMPLPGDGIIASHKDVLSAFSAEGELLWEDESISLPTSYVLLEDEVIFSTADVEAPLMFANEEGVYVWDDTLPGIPLVSGDQAWLYAEDGLYKLDLITHTLQLVYDLPAALMNRSSALPLANGGVLLLHTDVADRRLILFDARGELQWEFSVPVEGNPQLFELDGSLYLLTAPSFSTRGTYKTVEVFVIDPDQEQLFRIFRGGSRNFNPRLSWAANVAGQQLLIQIADTGTVLLNPEAARERMRP